MVYEFDDIEVDLDRYEPRRAGSRVHVERQVFDVLVYLLTNRQRVDELERFVSEHDR